MATNSARRRIVSTVSSDNVLNGLALDDVLHGVEFVNGLGGNDRLDGGTGNDVMLGFSGDDTYVVDSSGDKLFEVGQGGNDTIVTSVDLNLLDAQGSKIFGEIENLTAVSAPGAVLILQANDLDNVMTGNLGDDFLIGRGGDDILIGGEGADLLDGGVGIDKMTGGAGNDDYFVDNILDEVNESVEGEGNFDTILTTITWTLDRPNTAQVEDLTAAGEADIDLEGNALGNILVGNSGDNVLKGLGGDDFLIGDNFGIEEGIVNGGNDTLEGGNGSDFYYINSLGDVVIELGGDGGIDTVETTVSYQLGEFVENANLEGFFGAPSGRTLLGNALDNGLEGASSADILDGGKGADIMHGRDGDDTYRVDNVGDKATEFFSSGIDTVETTISFTLPSFANLENLTALGTDDLSLSGNEAGNKIIGNAGQNSLDGKDGEDILDGGSGEDRLIGGKGNDLYIVDDVDDLVIEFGGGGAGNDSVKTSVSYVLSDFVENGELLGELNGRTLTGSGFNNELLGSGGADVLNGLAGADRMEGGQGNDRYRIDNVGDLIIERVGQGIDTIETTISTTLAVFANVENLTGLGTGDLALTGNGSANMLTGNAGSNTLNGGGGIDTMIGGAGRDFYVLDNSADKIVESLNGGTDRAFAVAMSFSLAPLSQVEELYASSSTASGDFNFTGNNRDNIVSGNAGKNILTGGAGKDALLGRAGNDTLKGGTGINSLVGGAGADIFVFERAANPKNLNVIRDYEKADKIVIDNEASFFKAIGSSGKLSSDAFKLGKTAQDAQDRLIYDKASGNLFFDKDGTGGSAQILIAKIANKFALTVGEFQIV